jgi:heme exporter protein C
MMLKIFINPGQFNNFTENVNLPLSILSVLTLMLGLIIIFFFSPDDYQQGSTVKIMYIHVPAAWIALITFFIMTIYSILALAFKITFGFIVNKAIAPMGAIFTLICLVSGSLWGKPMWGTWWVWDARLTSVLILFITYIIIIFMGPSFSNFKVGEKIASIFIIISSINLPIIKFSVDWWNTLHQPASISKLSSPSIDISMLIPLIIMTLAFILIALQIALIRIKSEIIERKKFQI